MPIPVLNKHKRQQRPIIVDCEEGMMPKPLLITSPRTEKSIGSHPQKARLRDEGKQAMQERVMILPRETRPGSCLYSLYFASNEPVGLQNARFFFFPEETLIISKSVDLI